MNKPTPREDLELLLRTANAVADTMLPQARKLRNRISSLPESERHNMPEFSEDFTQEGLSSYITRLEEWIRNPWRTRSRTMLQQQGISCDGLPGEVLDDSEGTENTASGIKRLEQSANPALPMLRESGLVTSWLRDGHGAVKKRLDAIERAKEGFCRLVAHKVPEEVRTELLLRAVLDTSRLVEAEEIAKKAETLHELGCTISNDASWDETFSRIIKVHNSVTTLSELHETNITSFADASQKNNLAEVLLSLEEQVMKSKIERDGLLDEWRSLSSAAASIQISISSDVSANSIPKLRREVERLREEFRQRLGEEGMELLEFLRGKQGLSRRVNDGPDRACVAGSAANNLARPQGRTT